MINWLKQDESPFSRNLTVSFMVASGFGFFYAYYLLSFYICTGQLCEDVMFTAFLRQASLIYILAGVGYIGVGCYIFRAKKLNKTYSLFLSLAQASAFVISCFPIYAAAFELSKIT